MKRELSSGKEANREHARDLASFAMDGGTELIGVGETAQAMELLCATRTGHAAAARVGY